QTWVDGWLREAFSESASQLEQRPQVNIKTAQREFEYQAHYLNILHFLAHQLSLPELKIIAANLQEPAIAVDLILDVGNSHTCVIMVEDHTDD
ncbi:virulence factor SrfB, partial [Erwinia amylovora]|uniref:virulence factor SrfB n=1 Tax=Erwinia amylovora TaxID=552 RepID=UPI0020C0A5A8